MGKNFTQYRKLFVSTFLLSMFTFGGGYVIVSLMQKKFVEEYAWIEESEMLDIFAIAQSSPGVIAVNASLLIGYRVAGIGGAFLTLFATILPPLLIITIISFFYLAFKNSVIVQAALLGMRSGVAAVIVDVVIKMTRNVVKEKSVMAIFIMTGALIASFFFQTHVIFIILAGGFLGFCRMYYYKKRRKDPNNP
jgi:chromate transporter